MPVFLLRMVGWLYGSMVRKASTTVFTRLRNHPTINHLTIRHHFFLATRTNPDTSKNVILRSSFTSLSSSRFTPTLSLAMWLH